MGISIKNDEVEVMIRRLADATGESVTQAVARAVRERLELLEASSEEALRLRAENLRRLVEEARRLPVYDHRNLEDLASDEGFDRE